VSTGSMGSSERECNVTRAASFMSGVQTNRPRSRAELPEFAPKCLAEAAESQVWFGAPPNVATVRSYTGGEANAFGPRRLGRIDLTG
jgi:hypothetical protein